MLFACFSHTRLLSLTLNMPARMLLLFALLCLPGALAAGEIEPLGSIRAAVLGALDAGVEAELTLDPALKLPRCGARLQARRSSHGTVEVNCPLKSGWRLFVPVRIRRDQTVLVLTRAVAAGDTVSADMLAQETRDATRIVGAPLADPSAAIGQTTHRALAAGSVLTAAHLRAPDAVRRGDQVTLVSRRGGIEVRMAGRALAAGGPGERISAENLSSRRRVQGVVMGDGEVLVRH